ncbi:hypothetical protein KKD88_03800 [Patescibacteria group bacterium]|nr:hypothetical protein [Patescibacteria group bacterium]
MPLTEQERAELEALENPNVQFLSSAMGGIWSMFLVNKDKRKRRVVELRTKLRMEELGLDAKEKFSVPFNRDNVVELRTKLRMEELGLDAKENFEDFYRIRREEEELFDRKWHEEEELFDKKFGGEFSDQQK